MAVQKLTVTGDQDREIDRRMCEIKRQLRQNGGSPLDPERVLRKLQEIIEPEAVAGHVTLLQAISILGSDKVISAKQWAKKWEMKKPKNVPIRYSEATLRRCAEENLLGEDWRLVYIFGMDLREMRKLRGTDRLIQPCFDKDCIWLLKTEEVAWATKKPQAGYYLINFHGQFGNLNWNRQEDEIAKLGKEFERCHEAVFAEAILTIFMVNNGEQIAKDWWHWGVSASSDGSHVNISFPSDGLYVYNYWVVNSFQNLRVSLARKFDF